MACTFTYSVITAVYNVAPYLHDYFKSMTRQTLDFKKNICLILVDDGSTDNSAQIIQHWKQKYPDNIQYIKKENGGQSSARNLGLEYLKTPWVTFIDPDDFVHRNYFDEVEKAIGLYSEDNLTLVSCRIKYYFEQYRLYLNRHPLRSCFTEAHSIYTINEMKHHIQMSASTAFFKTPLIKKMHLRFDEKVKPNFEDAHFVNRYMIEYAHSSICFVKPAVYNYRRRKERNSTIDTVWSKKELFNDVLQYGCVDLIEKAKQKYTRVPLFIQNTILYHLAWYYRNLMNHNEKIAFLSIDEQNHFHQVVQVLFDDIDLDTIKQFQLANITFFEQSAWALLYKNKPLDYQIVFVQKKKNMLKLSFYANQNKHSIITLGDTVIDTDFICNEEYTFVNKPFINSYVTEIPLDNMDKILSIQIDKKPTYIQTDTMRVLDSIDIKDIQTDRAKKIKKAFHNLSRKLLIG